MTEEKPEAPQMSFQQLLVEQNNKIIEQNKRLIDLGVNRNNSLTTIKSILQWFMFFVILGFVISVLGSCTALAGI